MSPQDEAMDFFSKLDNARYAEFKTNYINSLQLKSCKPPVDLNETFTLANTYLKPKVAMGNGLSSTLQLQWITSARRRGRTRNIEGTRRRRYLDKIKSKRKAETRALTCREGQRNRSNVLTVRVTITSVTARNF